MYNLSESVCIAIAFAAVFIVGLSNINTSALIASGAFTLFAIYESVIPHRSKI